MLTHTPDKEQTRQRRYRQVTPESTRLWISVNYQKTNSITIGTLSRRRLVHLPAERAPQTLRFPQVSTSPRLAMAFGTCYTIPNADVAGSEMQTKSINSITFRQEKKTQSAGTARPKGLCRFGQRSTRKQVVCILRNTIKLHYITLYLCV